MSGSFHTDAFATMLRSRTRREFLRLAAGTVSATAASTLVPSAFAAAVRTRARTVVVTFGGGARDEETFAVEGQQNIPHLLNELIPQGTFYTQVVNRGILGHYVATASIVSGCYETFDNFIAQPTGNPTVFEYFRRGLGRPIDDAWVIAPSNGFQQIGSSRHGGYEGLGAGVILPKQLLTAAVSRQRMHSLMDYEHLLQDSYEMPVYRPSLSASDGELHLEQLASTAATADVLVTDTAVDKRFTPQAARFLHAMLEEACSLVVQAAHDVPVALLRRFKHRIALLTGLADLGGVWSTEATLSAMSVAADTVLEQAGVEARHLPGLYYLPALSIAAVVFFGGLETYRR